MAAIFESSPALKLDPRPGFVIKTRIVDGQGDHLYSTKVFINVCHEPRVPKPAGDFEPSRVFPLIVQNEWEIPIIVSLEKRSTDKKGVPSFVYDCCINSECYQWINVSPDLRMITIEWCLESVEMMHELVLERDYSLPKMASKGELSATEVSSDDLKNGLQKKIQDLRQNETSGLIEELHGEQEPDEELPELASIGGNRTRPLIEEIEEMSLKEKPPRANKEEEEKKDIEMIEERSQTGKIDHPEKTSSEPDWMKPVSTRQTKTEPKSTSRNSPKITENQLPYSFTMTPKRQGDQFYILFESKELTPKIEVSFGEELIIRNVDPERRLGQNNQIEIPIPANLVHKRTFLLEKKGQLYVFFETKS